MGKQASKEYHKEYRERNIEKRRVWNREWIQRNRERYNAMKYEYRDRVKHEVIAHYSNGTSKCGTCGFADIRALCIDHINDDGAAHRKQLGISGRSSSGGNSYEVLKREGYPSGLQVLCANCNLIKEIDRKNKNRRKNPHYRQYGDNNPV